MPLDHAVVATNADAWPSTGAIFFDNVCMRYRPGLPYVLRYVNLSIGGGEKIGIVGRTGSGKSTLASCLLRLVELSPGKGSTQRAPFEIQSIHDEKQDVFEERSSSSFGDEGDLEDTGSGAVYIDGVDISTMGLNKLRSNIAVIAQDPVLFSGTLRSNLDPFDQFSDSQLWDCMYRTRLAPNSQFSSLDAEVEENGVNFSVGQRQLICIGRALLSGCKIIILDEATAAVDVETDAAIQQSFREDFKDATVLTVAHRLNTILDADRVLVMDNGRVAEFDAPSTLLRDKQSFFSKLVEAWESSHE